MYFYVLVFLNVLLCGIITALGLFFREPFIMKFYTIFFLFLFSIQLCSARDEEFYKPIKMSSFEFLIDDLNQAGFSQFTKIYRYKIEELANQTITLQNAYWTIQDLFLDCCKFASRESEKKGWDMSLRRDVFFRAFLKENTKALLVLYRLEMLVRSRLKVKMTVEDFKQECLRRDLRNLLAFYSYGEVDLKLQSNVNVDTFGRVRLKSNLNDTCKVKLLSIDIDY